MIYAALLGPNNVISTLFANTQSLYNIGSIGYRVFENRVLSKLFGSKREVEKIALIMGCIIYSPP